VILEIADIRIHPGKEAEFAQAIRHAIDTVMPKVKGAHDFRVHQCIETPQRFVLQITWDTLEDHTVGFRQGPQFAEWRAIIGPFFASPPHVEHFNLVAQAG